MLYRFKMFGKSFFSSKEKKKRKKFAHGWEWLNELSSQLFNSRGKKVPGISGPASQRPGGSGRVGPHSRRLSLTFIVGWLRFQAEFQTPTACA